MGDSLKSFTAFALENFPLITPGDNIARLFVELVSKNHFQIEDGDVIVIAQKIFSKAENRIRNLKDVVPSKRAERIAKETGKHPQLVELVLNETKTVIKASPEVLLVENTRGLVCINAGIDKSNVQGRENYALLPENSDKSAEICRKDILTLTGKNVAVIICDTYSRPFRRGQVNYAIGVAGIRLFKDYRGKQDLFGQTLKVKNIAVVDEIAATAELLLGQGAEGTPIVVFKGLNTVIKFSEKSSIEGIRISRTEDLFNEAL